MLALPDGFRGFLHNVMLMLAFVFSCSQMVNKGGSGCTPKKQCGACQGDCDSDRDCGRGLKCFQRNDKTRVPGCEVGASGDVKTYDYCVSPRDDPRLVAHWDSGTCGPGADDQNWAWCQKEKGICPSSVAVSTSLCSSGSAYLKEKKGAHTAGGCHFKWWAQYTCAVSTGPVAPHLSLATVLHTHKCLLLHDPRQRNHIQSIL